MVTPQIKKMALLTTIYLCTNFLIISLSVLIFLAELRPLRSFLSHGAGSHLLPVSEVVNCVELKNRCQKFSRFKSGLPEGIYDYVRVI